MARETKVGLLAGLAFIICFAVILANRGREDPGNREFGFLRSEKGIPSGSTHPESAHSDLVGHVPSPQPRAAVSSASESTFDSTIARAGRAHVQPPQELTLEEIAARLRVSPPASGEPGSARPIPNETLPLAPASSGRPSSPGEASPTPARTPGRTYTVSAGDTLSKIAAAYYGSKSAAVVSAVYDANRALLPSRDEVPLGIELTLPDLPGLRPESNATGRAPPTPAGASSRPPSKSDAKPDVGGRQPAKSAKSEVVDPNPKTTRSYKVKKGDRYYQIALKQLGDGSRWREIHELNKDRFADPAMIREGVDIRLPDPAASNKKGRKR